MNMINHGQNAGTIGAVEYTHNDVHSKTVPGHINVCHMNDVYSTLCSAVVNPKISQKR